MRRAFMARLRPKPLAFGVKAESGCCRSTSKWHQGPSWRSCLRVAQDMKKPARCAGFVGAPGATRTQVRRLTPRRGLRPATRPAGRLQPSPGGPPAWPTGAPRRSCVRVARDMKKPARCAGFVGAPGATRTHDLLLRRQTLYPTELRVPDLQACLEGGWAARLSGRRGGRLRARGGRCRPRSWPDRLRGSPGAAVPR